MDKIPHETVRNFVKVIKLRRAILERELNQSGVYRSQHQILMYIADHPNASQKEIADMQNVSTATIAVSLKKLEKGGYIKRASDEHDNRVNQIGLTEEGVKMVGYSREFFDKVENQMFSGFSQEEMSLMNHFLKKIQKNLESMLPETEREE